MAAEASKEDFTKPRREIRFVMTQGISVPMTPVKADVRFRFLEARKLVPAVRGRITRTPNFLF
jgi:hypothetical protein